MKKFEIYFEKNGNKFWKNGISILKKFEIYLKKIKIG